jgi:hypothetical protein
MHKQIDHDGLLYICGDATCGKGFATTTALGVHLKQHGHKPKLVKQLVVRYSRLFFLF